jgi:serine/threonine protein kinase
MHTDYAEEEYAISTRIQKIPLWKNYYIVAEAICEPAEKQDFSKSNISQCDILKKHPLNRLRMLRTTYGGTPLVSHKFNFKAESFYDMALHLIRAGALLALYGIVHRDLHYGNILIDSAGVPRIIDFNLSIDVRDKIEDQIGLHTYNVNLFQEPPDSTIVNAVAQGLSAEKVIEDIMRKKDIIRSIQSVLGVSKKDMHESLEEFYAASPSMQTGDYVKWFKSYWRTFDSWSIGVGLTHILEKQLMWPSFQRETSYGAYSAKILKVLRGMCAVDPRRRLDCVQALAALEPKDFIISKFAGEWLKKVGHHA